MSDSIPDAVGNVLSQLPGKLLFTSLHSIAGRFFGGVILLCSIKYFYGKTFLLANTLIDLSQIRNDIAHDIVAFGLTFLSVYIFGVLGEYFFDFTVFFADKVLSLFSVEKKVSQPWVLGNVFWKLRTYLNPRNPLSSRIPKDIAFNVHVASSLVKYFGLDMSVGVMQDLSKIILDFRDIRRDHHFLSEFSLLKDVFATTIIVLPAAFSRGPLEFLVSLAILWFVFSRFRSAYFSAGRRSLYTTYLVSQKVIANN